MTDEAKKCLSWIRDEYNINFGLVEVNGKNIVDLVLEWHNKALEEKQEAKGKQNEDPNYKEDFKKVADENGRIWYNRTHLSEQREESRLIHPGELIVYKTSNGSGMMIVNSFDFESDFAARSYVELSSFNGDDNVSFVTRSAPGIESFTFANDEEIKNFFKYILDHNAPDFYYYFNLDSKSTPEYIKDRFTHYIKELLNL